MSAKERMATTIAGCAEFIAPGSEQEVFARAEQIAQAVTASGFSHPDDAEWCVYEDAAGEVWAVEPSTRVKAEYEASLVGDGHRAVPLELGRAMKVAFVAGRRYEHGKD